MSKLFGGEMFDSMYKSCVIRCVKIVSSGLFVVEFYFHQTGENVLHASRVTQYWMLIKLNIYPYVCLVGAVFTL